MKNAHPLDDLLTYTAANAPALILAAVLGALLMAAVMLPAPSRHDKPTRTRAATSNRKSGRTTVTGGAR